MGPVRAARQDPRRHPRGRTRVRHRALRLPRLLLQHPRVGLDPVAAAGDLLERGRARVPRVAAREQLRGDQRARRLVRLGRHRGLLPEPLGARLRLVRQVRPRLHRPRGAGEGRSRRPAQEGHPRVERRGPRQAPDHPDRPRRHRLPGLRPAQRELRLVELRRGHRRERRHRRPVAVHRCDGEREARPVAGHREPRRAHRRRGARGLGRARRRIPQDHRRAARAARRPRRREPRALRRHGPPGAPRRRAHPRRRRLPRPRGGGGSRGIRPLLCRRRSRLGRPFARQPFVRQPFAR